MLNKECCKKCWKKTIKEVYGWFEDDDLDWEKGKIFCPEEYVEEEESQYRKITQLPPENCPYYMENIL